MVLTNNPTCFATLGCLVTCTTPKNAHIMHGFLSTNIMVFRLMDKASQKFGMGKKVPLKQKLLHNRND